MWVRRGSVEGQRICSCSMQDMRRNTGRMCLNTHTYFIWMCSMVYSLLCRSHKRGVIFFNFTPPGGVSYSAPFRHTTYTTKPAKFSLALCVRLDFGKCHSSFVCQCVCSARIQKTFGAGKGDLVTCVFFICCGPVCFSDSLGQL